MRRRVVPVSTMPAVVAKIVREPYVIDASTPKNSLEGRVVVIGANRIVPTNFEESTPPQVISPFMSLPVMLGSKETPIDWAEMVPAENKLSVTVGIRELVAGDKVSSVRSTGPIPRIPSTPSNPIDVDATPMDCLAMVRPGAIVTWSVNSIPENEPDPYITATLLVVWVLVLVFT
jgi:hypothetical protein